MAVGVVEDVLAVGVVRRPEGVGPDPVEQGEVVDEVGVVVGLADDAVVLVHAETLEVERLPVDEELRSVDLDGPDADLLVDRVVHRARIVDQPDLEVVEVPVPRTPEVRVRHLQRCGPSRPGRDIATLGIVQHDPDAQVVLVGCAHAPPDPAGAALEPGGHRDVLHQRAGRCGHHTERCSPAELKKSCQ